MTVLELAPLLPDMDRHAWMAGASCVQKEACPTEGSSRFCGAKVLAQVSCPLGSSHLKARAGDRRVATFTGEWVSDRTLRTVSVYPYVSGQGFLQGGSRETGVSRAHRALSREVGLAHTEPNHKENK